MDRRRFLAASGAAATGALAGCAGPFGTVTLDGETVVEDDETYLEFRHEGERVADFGALYREEYAPDDLPLGFRTTVWHREGTHLDAIDQRLRSPPHSPTGVPAQVYLATPEARPFPEMHYHLGDDRHTVVEVPEVGGVGRGTLTFEYLLDPRSDPPDPLTVGVEASFHLSGGTLSPDYVCRGEFTFEVPLTGQ
ncbi:MAG: hypothetical protein ABEJ04_06915 [Halobacteriaceae archaeon]